MKEEIPAPLTGVRPAGLLQERLTPQFIGDAQALERSEARHTPGPVLVLRLAGGLPVASDELANTACDHRFIVA
jgi:hypothetical protein